ncbi:MAG: hypothetical protein CVU49_00995 [Candidatus Cloacimonetes bacterium HGW-Cloacimonetes-2]|jgi:hypothetical protein|nr:MAG: hypothetical protein CVU49_00995 [Candidatus Cloacimonetes bacterium HGW-Cloacimonetes-2]
MGKVKSFQAKTAHDRTNEGKMMCEVCKTEIKRIKLITNKKSTGGWVPQPEFQAICKCNEADIMAGKTV